MNGLSSFANILETWNLLTATWRSCDVLRVFTFADICWVLVNGFVLSHLPPLSLEWLEFLKCTENKTERSWHFRRKASGMATYRMTAATQVPANSPYSGGLDSLHSFHFIPVLTLSVFGWLSAENWTHDCESTSQQRASLSHNSGKWNKVSKLISLSLKTASWSMWSSWSTGPTRKCPMPGRWDAGPNKALIFKLRNWIWVEESSQVEEKFASKLTKLTRLWPYCP